MPGTGAGNVISGNSSDRHHGDSRLERQHHAWQHRRPHCRRNRDAGQWRRHHGQRRLRRTVSTIDGSSNTIGGTSASDRNIISGNYYRGVVDQRRTDNVVEGNFIGTDITGSVGLGNGLIPVFTGVIVYGARATRSAARPPGPATSSPATPTTASRSPARARPATWSRATSSAPNAAGTAAIANANAGVEIDTGASGNTIGGTHGRRTATSSAGNIGNAYGVEIDRYGTTANLVEGNFIGTDATGTVAIGNGTGVQIDTGATGNTIGGTTASARNVISGNTAYGVHLTTRQRRATGRGQLVGTDVTGDASLANYDGDPDPGASTTRSAAHGRARAT